MKKLKKQKRPDISNLRWTATWPLQQN